MKILEKCEGRIFSRRACSGGGAGLYSGVEEEEGAGEARGKVKE